MPDALPIITEAGRNRPNGGPFLEPASSSSVLVVDRCCAFVKAIIAAREESGVDLVCVVLNVEEGLIDKSGCSDGEGAQDWDIQPMREMVLVWPSLESGVGTEKKGMGCPCLE